MRIALVPKGRRWTSRTRFRSNARCALGRGLGRTVGALRVDPRSIHAFVIGEHGDSEVPVWSSANVAGLPLASFATQQVIPFDDAVRSEVFRQTRYAAYAIIERKGSTHYAIASALVRICEAVLRDQRTILSVSSTSLDRVRGHRVAGSLALATGFGTHAAVFHVVGVPLAFLGARRTCHRAGSHERVDRLPIWLGGTRQDLRGRGADGRAVEVEPNASHEHVAVRLHDAGVRAAEAGGRAVVARFETFL